MQERRATIRVRHPARVQYCSSEDLQPRDGKLRDVSDRGAGLLTREVHRLGEMVTVGFLLPGDRSTWTATGVIRWIEQPSGRWHPVGLDWFQLEEGTRNRLHRFLENRAAAAEPAVRPAAAPGRRLAFWSVFLTLSAVALVGAYAWITALQWQNKQLSTGIVQRDEVITELQQEEGRLTMELETTRTQLAETAKEIAALDAQAQGFGAEVSRLSEQVDEFQASYIKMREEREALMARVLDLEQERLALTNKLAGMEQLRTAVREAIDARETTAGSGGRQSAIQARRSTDRELLSTGNRGYLVREGQPARKKGTGGIKVHVLEPSGEPETTAP
jgi:hypothetical protein